MKQTLLLAIATILALGGQAYAQWSVRKPARSERQTLRVADQMRSAPSALGLYTLPRLTSSEAELRSLSEARDREFRVLTYAHSRSLPKNVMHAGQWLESDSGDFVWRLRIVSPEARGIALSLEQYQLPIGAALYAYGSEGGRIGALTNLNNSPDGFLQLAPLSGEAITLEYELPKGQKPQLGDLPPFVITRLEHDFLGVRNLRGLRRGEAKFGEPFFDAVLSLEKMNCAPNVVAVPEHRQAARSVVVLAVGGSMSSGALINTPRSDGKAYILTAAHNVNQLYDVTDINAIKAMVRASVIFFGFESPSLEGNIRGSEEMSLSGAELVAYDPEADMAVLEITGLPRSADGTPLPIPTEYNAYFSGWSLSPTPSPPYFGIHHPGILTKRYSEVEDTSLSVVDFAATSRGIFWEMKHWHVKRWAIGSTAAGSSGSPLFDGMGRIIGALTAGYSYCPNTRTGRQPEDDYYYAIHRAWQATTPFASLRNVLDPDDTGVQSCPGYDPNEQEALYRLSDFYAADRGLTLSTIAPDIEGVGRLITIDGSASPLGAYLIFKGDKSLEESFPSLLLELRPYEPKTKKLGEPLWRRQVDAARYQFYRPYTDENNVRHYDQGAFESGTRTLGRDTIELFIPINQHPTPNLPQGEYLICLRNQKGGSLDLPLLQQNLRRTSLDISNMWSYSHGRWEETKEPAKLWLDLLVRSATPQNSKYNPKPNLEPTPQEVAAYYYGGQLMIRIPKELGSGKVYIFSEDGKLVYQLDLTEGEHTLPLSLAASAVYVAKIETSTGNRVLKFIVK